MNTAKIKKTAGKLFFYYNYFIYRLPVFFPLNAIEMHFEFKFSFSVGFGFSNLVIY